MKWLFIYAHPDDETVAAGGTIRLLADLGHQVEVVLATSGQAGEIQKVASKKFKKLGSVELLRRQEVQAACDILGVSRLTLLDYQDGEITNKDTWGRLTLDLIDQIEASRPDAIITFDHTGWYFHLDHVAVSIATLRAIDQADHHPNQVWFSLFHPPGITEKWSYVYPEKIPTTHIVDIGSVRAVKVKALAAHESQQIGFVDKLIAGEMDTEHFQLVSKASTDVCAIFTAL